MLELLRPTDSLRLHINYWHLMRNWRESAWLICCVFTLSSPALCDYLQCGASSVALWMEAVQTKISQQLLDGLPTFCADINGPKADESFRHWWSTCLSSSATVRLAFSVLGEMSQQLLDGLPWFGTDIYSHRRTDPNDTGGTFFFQATSR